LRSKTDGPEALQDEALAAPLLAARAAEAKKAGDLRILDLRGFSSFTDFFVICG
jgi:ribosomal silencing factor RsfS